MHGYTQQEKRYPVEPRMNLDVGRLCARDFMHLGAITVGALAIGTLAAYLFYLVLPGRFEIWSGWRVLLALFGGSVAFIAYGGAITVARLTYRDWIRYQQRLQDWHDVAIESYEQSGGVQVETNITEWELSATRPMHILAVALAVHARVQAGDTNPFSVRAIEGACWIGGLRMGDVTPTQSEQIGRALAELGLVRGRAPRRAGEWVPKNADEVVTLVRSNWRKLGRSHMWQYGNLYEAGEIETT